MKNHWDTIAIIGVNLAVASVIMALCLSHNGAIYAANARMDAANTRMDTMYVMFYDLLKQTKCHP